MPLIDTKPNFGGEGEVRSTHSCRKFYLYFMFYMEKNFLKVTMYFIFR